MKQIFHFILSFSLSSWVYSEMVLIAPEMEPVAEQLIEATRIPTHDQWGIIQKEAEPKKIKKAEKDLRLTEEELSYLNKQPTTQLKKNEVKLIKLHGLNPLHSYEAF